MDRLEAHTQDWGSRRAGTALLGPHYLIDHLISTAQRTSAEIESIPSVPRYALAQAIVGALLHDLGKASQEWQFKAKANNNPPPHAEHGAAICFMKDMHLAAQMVGGHHTGLRNFGLQYGASNLQHAAIQAWNFAYKDVRGKEWFEMVKNAIAFAKAEPIPGISPWTYDRILGNDEIAARKFFNNLSIRNDMQMGFGTMVRADRIDTANYVHGGFAAKIASSRSRIENIIWRFIWNEIIVPAVDSLPEGNRGISRQWLQQFTTERALRIWSAQSTFGIASLAAPTGMGKFLASLASAVALLKMEEDAVQKGMIPRMRWNKIIIVEPYLTVIDDVRKQLEKIQNKALDEGHGLYKIMEPGYYDDNLLDHSTGGAFRWSDHQSIATMTWDYPLILTSLTRFIETLFSNDPIAAMRFPALAGALVVIDESQLIPRVNSQADNTNLFEATMAMIHDLHRYGTSFIMPTATPPPFERPDSVLSSLDMRPPKGTVEQLISESTQSTIARKATLAQVSFNIKTPLPVKTIVEEAIENPRGILIFNTKRTAFEAFDEAKRLFQGPVRLMTGLKMRKHNLQALDFVNGLLNAEQNVFLVSTSMIQTGVNIDAPGGTRQEGALADICHARGRFNRNGKMGDAKGILHIRRVAMPNAFHSPSQQSEAADVFRTWQELEQAGIEPNRKMFDPVFYRDFYEMAMHQDPHCQLGITGPRPNLLLQAMAAMELEKVSKYGRLIGDTDAVVIIPHNEESQRLAEKVLAGDRLNPGDRTTLYENSITLFKELEDRQTQSSETDRALAKGLIVPTMTKNLYVATRGAYDEEVGLKLY